jgi:phosphatase NudJ
MLQGKKESVKGQWNFPAGRLENGEDPVEGAIREAKEEAGMDVSPKGIVGIYAKDSDLSDKRVMAIVFYSQIDDPKIDIQESEIQDFNWVSPKNLENLELRSSYINDAIDQRQAGVLCSLDILREDKV